MHRRRGIEGIGAMLIILTLPNRAPAVELVIRQPQDGQPSSTLPPYITQDGGLRDTNVHSTACPTSQYPSSTGVSDNSQSVPKLYDLLPVTV